MAGSNTHRQRIAELGGEKSREEERSRAALENEARRAREAEQELGR